MAAEWTRMPDGQREDCASVSCGHAPASWRMEAGGTGSFFCEVCHAKITGPNVLHVGPAVLHTPKRPEVTNGVTVISIENK